MPIRLIKVSKNLNVGINSLVEFLHKKGIEVEANPNVKIEDEHYEILVNEFGKDKSIKLEALETREKLHRRDDKRETVAIKGYGLPENQAPKRNADKETIETEIPQELKPQLNVVGSIDLDNLNKKLSTSPKIEPVIAKKEKEETTKEAKATEVVLEKSEDLKIESSKETDTTVIIEPEQKPEVKSEPVTAPKIEKDITTEVDKHVKT